jgi:hypothetical protein
MGGGGGGLPRQAKTQDFLGKTVFFCEKTGPMFFFVFFALFARAMCGAGKGVLGDFLRLHGKFRQYFWNFHHFFHRLRKY